VVIGSRRGASSSGCLLSLLIFVAVLYYGVNIGEVFFRYYRLVDEMQTQTRLAAALDDGTIRRRIQAAVEEIGIPDSAGGRQLIVRRTASPRQITIESRYSETVTLPFFNHSFSFHPKAQQPL
jgi:hypothetical protein